MWSISAGSNVPSTLGQYASYCVNPRRVIHKYRCTTHISGRAFVTSDIAKMLKNVTYCCLYMILLRGPITYILESSRQAGVKL